jgi:chromosome segregation ATPase
MTSKKEGGEKYSSDESPLSKDLQDQAAEILRKQLDSSISAQQNIHAELKRQLEFKEKELEALKNILVKKNHELSGISKDLDSKKETDKFYVDRLKEALLKKDEANKHIFNNLRDQLAAKDEEIRKIELSSIESSKANERLAKQLNQQLTEAYEQIDQLKTFVANETARSENLNNVFEKAFAEKEALISELQSKKSQPAENPALAAQIDQLVGRLKEKEATCKSLQMQLAKVRFQNDDISRRLKEKNAIPDESIKENELRQLNSRIIQLEREIKVKEESSIEASRSNDKVVKQLNSQLKDAYSEIDQLKQFMSAESVKSSGLEEEFDRQIAEKDAQLAELEKSLKESARPRQSVVSMKDISELRHQLAAREEAYNALQADFVKLKAQQITLSKKYETGKKIIDESEDNFSQMADEVNVQHQHRIKELITKNAENEASLRSEIESLKAEARKKDELIQAEAMKVDDALSQFSLRYNQLLKIRNADGKAALLGEYEKIKAEKENMATLLKDAEAKLQRAIEREASVERREQLLMKEQEGINRQLEMLNVAGFEIGRTKDYLKKKLSEVESAPESMAAVMEEVPKTPEVKEVRMDISQPEKVMERIMPAAPKVVEKPKIFQAKKEDFFNASTYSEIDELKSVIEIASQNGDSDDQIRKSLIDSGYSKASIDKAFGSIQTVKR